MPRWRNDFSEIFYLAPDNTMMSVPIKFSANRDSFEPGTPVALFRSRIFGNGTLGGKRQYAVSRDGRRFVAIVLAEDEAPTPITLLLNWKPPKK